MWGLQNSVLTESESLWLLLSCSVVSDSAAPWTAAHQAFLSFTISWSLLKLVSLSQWCHPLSSPSPPSIFPSIRVFPMSEFFESGGQSTGASASASVLLEMAYHSLMICAITCPPRDVSNLRLQGQEDSVRQAPCSAKVLASVLVRPERKFEMCLYFSEIYNVNSLDKSLKMTYFDHKYVFFLLSYQNIFSTLWDFYYQILIT